MRPVVIPICLSIGLALMLGASAEDVGIRAPEGFEVSLYAADELAHDIYSMTIDSHGRVVVAGAGYVKTLHDRDGDGQADAATLFSSIPNSGAHGLLFLGRDLLCTGDNSLMLLRDTDDDGVADGDPEIWARLRHPEHGANGMTEGPDGWIYLICGNDAGVSEPLASTAGSPVKQPQCGAVVRFSPDGQRSEIVAHGFRNPYDLAFNADGHLFTVDADGERDHHLPWYSPTRLFDIAQGMHHGWVLNGWQRSWNRPPWFLDSVERLAEVGRGSPTGVTVYRHRQFPERYRNGVLSCCWTLGRIYHFPLERRGASYATNTEVFLETTGDVGFAPVDIAVGPEGDLFVAIGGRRTRGSVFRVRYTGARDDAAPSQESLPRVLRANEPLASWSRREWEPLARDLGSGSFVAASEDSNLTTAERIRAVEILTDLFDGVPAARAASMTLSAPDEVVARIAWSLGRSPQGTDGTRLLVGLTHHEAASVRLAAWQAIQTVDVPEFLVQELNWRDLNRSPIRRVRAIATLVSASINRSDFLEPAQDDAWSAIAAARRKHHREGLSGHDFPAILTTFSRAVSDEQRLEAVRLLQLALGDVSTTSDDPKVFAGYVAADSEAVSTIAHEQVTILAGAFPAANRALNLELARLLGMLRAADAELQERISDQFTLDSAVTDDLHYLMVLAQLRGSRTETTTQSVADALVRLHVKMDRDQRYPSRNWPSRVGETFAMLCGWDAALAPAVAAHREWGHPGHSLFIGSISSSVRDLAIHKLIASVNQSQDEEAWTPELVEVVSLLPPEESFAILRQQWSDYRLQDAILGVLSRQPVDDDRARFVESLASPQPHVVELAAKSLGRLPPSTSADELLAAMTALRRYCASAQYKSERKALSDLLAMWTGENLSSSEGSDLLASYQPWFTWFEQRYPEAAQRLSGFAGANAAAWQSRLAVLDWSQGDLSRGKRVFEKQACHRCHVGDSRLGPDLAGAAGRFSRDDLFAAIVDPSKDVSPLYRTTQIVTGTGKQYHGLVVYESPDGTLLQVTPDQTIRIAGEEIVSATLSSRSLMPVGLLDGLQDGDLADLYVYMQSLRKPE